MRRDFDTINPQTHPFVIVPSPETEKGAHPFWYAAVLGVFHADVQHAGDDSRDFRFNKMEFLWVRWLGVVPGHVLREKSGEIAKNWLRSGFRRVRLWVFGSLTRCSRMSSHTVFHRWKNSGSSYTDSQGESLGRVGTEGDDWANYYVGM
jgi:hypothetical protein